LAAAFGVSTNTIQKWTRDPSFPGGREGPWDHAKVKKWKELREKDGTLNEDESDADVARALRRARLAVEEETARKLKFANDERQGLLVNHEEMAIEVKENYAMIRDRVLALPDQLATKVPPAAKAEVIANSRLIVNKMLNEMANWQNRMMQPKKRKRH